MKPNRTYTEKIFDDKFNATEGIRYTFNKKDMGRRDRKVLSILESFGINGKSCLDIGSGTGRWIQYVKQKNAGFIGGVDISLSSIKNFQHNCNKVQKADIEFDKLDFDNEFFDIIISFMVLEHLRDPANFISEVKRISRIGGLIIMSIPNLVSFRSRLRMLLGYLPVAVTSDNTHVKFYTKKELKALFKPFGLQPVLIPTSFSIHPTKSKRLRIPSNQITNSFDDHLLFLVKKIL